MADGLRHGGLQRGWKRRHDHIAKNSERFHCLSGEQRKPVDGSDWRSFSVPRENSSRGPCRNCLRHLRNSDPAVIERIFLPSYEYGINLNFALAGRCCLSKYYASKTRGTRRPRLLLESHT